jgi:hypothetical protein
MEVRADETNIDRGDIYNRELLLMIYAGIIILKHATSTICFVHYIAEIYFKS